MKKLLVLSAVVCLFAFLTACNSASTDIIYKSEKFGFSLSLPSDWKDNYYVKESNDAVAIYHKGTWAKYGDGAGRLFTITVFNPKNKWEKEGKELQDMVGMKKIFENDKEVFAVSYPTDVQSMSSDAKLSQEYKQMEKDLAGIIMSFKLQ